jgi:branched-chain amino acid transport system substrate-binding protein
MKRFIDEDVSLVIAACTTANALAIKSLATKAELPVLLTVSTGNIATERSPFMFRCCFNDSFQGKAMADFVYKDKMFNNIGVLFDLNDQVTYRRDLARAFAAEFKKISGKTVTEAGYRSGTGDVLPALQKLKRITPAAVFAPSDVTDAAMILKKARQNALYCTFLGSDGWDRPELFENCGPKPAPCYMTSMFSVESELPGVKEFARSIKAHTGSLPTTDTAQAYDAMNIAVKALQLSRSKNEVRSGLYQIQNYPGVTGTTSIEADGNARKTIFIKEVIKGADGKPAFKLIKIISPK